MRRVLLLGMLSSVYGAGPAPQGMTTASKTRRTLLLGVLLLTGGAGSSQQGMTTPCIPPSLEFNTTFLTHETTHFLPPHRGAAHSSYPRHTGGATEAGQRTVFPAQDDPVSAAVAALQAAIHRAQRPSVEACERHGVRLSITEGGFGSTLNAMVKPLVHALLHNKVPLSAQMGPNKPSRIEQMRYTMSPALPLQLYKNETRCESESIECFLQPLSNCSEELRLKLPASMLGRRFYEVAPNKVLLQSAPHRARTLRAQLNVAGNFNTVSLILAGLVRPSAAVAARLAQVKRALGWPGIAAHLHRRRPLLIGLHLRAGDSCTWTRARHNRTCQPLAAYLPAVRAMEQAYGRARQVYVYLATDDSTAAAEARRLSALNPNLASRPSGDPNTAGAAAAELGAGRREPGRERRGRAGHAGATDEPRPAANTDESYTTAGDGGGKGEGGGGAIWLVRSDDEVRRDWHPKQKSKLVQIEFLLKAKAIDGHREAMDLMTDLLLLVECDAFVGKFSSNVDRIAYSLMAARRGTALRQWLAGRAPAGKAASGVASGATSHDGTSHPPPDASALAANGDSIVAARAASASARDTVGPEPALCLPPYVSLDHPWCHDFVSWFPVREPQPPPYAGASSPGPEGGKAVVGGIWC